MALPLLYSLLPCALRRSISSSALHWISLMALAVVVAGCQQPAKLDVSPIQTLSMSEGTEISPSFTLDKGDGLEVRVWRHDEFDAEPVVDQNGEIELPGLGVMLAEGRTIPEMRETIKERLKKYLKEPQVTVTSTTVVSRKVYVLGEVESPGVQVFSYDYYLWDALAHSGGFTSDADQNNVLLLRKAHEDIYRPYLVGLSFDGVTNSGFATRGFEVYKDDIIYAMPTGLAKAGRIADKISAVLNPVLSIERATVLWPELINAVSGTTGSTSSTVIVSP